MDIVEEGRKGGIEDCSPHYQKKGPGQQMGGRGMTMGIAVGRQKEGHRLVSVLLTQADQLRTAKDLN